WGAAIGPSTTHSRSTSARSGEKAGGAANDPDVTPRRDSVAIPAREVVCLDIVRFSFVRPGAGHWGRARERPGTRGGCAANRPHGRKPEGKPFLSNQRGSVALLSIRRTSLKSMS